MSGRASTRRVTSDDVAAAAGVSRATVSYVMNNNPRHTIPEATRLKVLEAIDKLGYSPSAAARTLAIGRSDAVVYLMPDLPFNATVGAFLERLSSALAEDGLTLLVRPWAKEGAVLPKLMSAISPVAVLTSDPLSALTRASLEAAGVDAVFSLTDVEQFADVQRQIGRTQGQVLVDGGHRNIAVALPADTRTMDVALVRLAGIEEVCSENGLHPPELATIPIDISAAAQALREWTILSTPITGVCAHDDDTALAVLAAAHALNLNVPDDVAVVGVDDTAAARVSIPPLTSVLWDPKSLAEKTARLIVGKLTGHDTASSGAAGDRILLVRRASA